MLAEKELPFRLPLLLPALSGDVFLPVEDETGVVVIATLYPFLQGEVLQECTSENAALAGRALALLDQALANLPALQPPADFRSLGAFGKLAELHPLILDPIAAIERLPLARAKARQLQAIFAHIIDHAETWYAQLPQQLLHRDVDPSNLLIDNREVSAILDFELAARDIRALDLSVSLSWWPVNRMGTGTEWEIIDALGRAYMSVLSLTEAELRALPDMIRMRDAASLIHRIGRCLAGLEAAGQIQSRVDFSLRRSDWLITHKSTFLEHAFSWR